MLKAFRSLPFLARFLNLFQEKGYELKGQGIEIGAYNEPVSGISPIYVDRFSEFAGKECLVDVISDAACLPFRPATLDYIVSSHLIEHVPNPIKAVIEWFSILKKGGILYMVVPDARYTFDCRRRRTSIEHLMDDYINGCTECDPTHIDEFTENADISRMNLGLTHDEMERLRVGCNLLYHDLIAQGMGINIHFHVFEPGNFMAMMDLVASKYGHPWKLLELKERFPPERGDGFLTVFRKN